MTMCPYCDKVYDESEDSKCPYCNNEEYGGSKVNIVYDDKEGKALELSDEEYEEFKKTHPEYK